MKELFKYLLLALLVATSSLQPRAAIAEDIVIQDSSGVARGTSPVDGLGRVDFAVVDAAGNPAEGAVVTLTNTATGEVLTSNSVGGAVAFENVAAGTWTVASATPGLTFTNVTILAVSAGAAAGTGVAAGTVLGVIGAGGAATAVGIGIHDATDGTSSSSELSPSS